MSRAVVIGRDTAPEERGIGVDRPASRMPARALTPPRLAVLNVGWIAVGVALVLSILGVVTIVGTTEANLAGRQLRFVAIGVLAAAIVAVPHPRLLQRLSYPLLIATTLLLVFLLVPGVPESIVRPRHGARRWINLVIMDFQPSEVAKIAFVLALANYLRWRKNHRRFLGLVPPFALTFVPMGLILVEPDLGTAMLFLPTLFAMLIAAGAKMKHITLVVVLGLACAPAMYPLLKPHQKDRILALVSQIRGDERHDDDIAYQGDRALTIAGSGGWSGVGEEHTKQFIIHNHLPEEHNDMIFAVVAARWGFFGGAGLIAAFLAFALSACIAAARTKDPFSRMVLVGITAMVLTQMTVNVGMTIGLFPITGMTLPFVSYGGSSLVANWMMAGLILGAAMRRTPRLARESFQFASDDDDYR